MQHVGHDKRTLVQGHVEGWGKVADAFRANFEGNPGEVGAACCVYLWGASPIARRTVRGAKCSLQRYLAYLFDRYLALQDGMFMRDIALNCYGGKFLRL